ncbi:MAG: chemotaxis protein CheX [Candidatus Aenigmarchaeota archaeon]|nr:chemotaxis protein CheX [Candidatus Aenigmarchaeota archaeon]
MLTGNDIEEMKATLNKSVENTLESLSLILKKQMKMSYIDILELRLEDVIEAIGQPDDLYGCIQVEIFGESEIKKSILGHLLLLMDADSARKFVSSVTGEEASDVKKHLDFFREVGNIISGAFLASVSEYFRFEFRESLPDFCFDILGSCIDSALCSIAATTEKNLIFKVVVKTEEEDVEIKILLLFYPNIYKFLEFKKEIE